MQTSPQADAQHPARHMLSGVPEGYDSVFLAGLAQAGGRTVIHIAADDLQCAQTLECLKFFAPGVEVLHFPAWDCLPYDRVSPTAEVMGLRLRALSRLLAPAAGPRIVLTTAAAAMQRVPPRALLENASFTARRGGALDLRKLQAFLAANGYHRADTVREPGEFALRGGLIDIFPSGAEEPMRLDLFGEEIEHIRAFDPLSQRSTEDREEISLYPVSEVLLTEDASHLFRARYREAFGAVRAEDALYESVSACRRHAGMEHWLPFYYETLETLFDYAPQAAVTLGHQAGQARHARLQQVEDLYKARLSIMQAAKKDLSSLYRPVPLEALFLTQDGWDAALAAHETTDFSPFAPMPGQADGGGRKGRDFGDVRAQAKGGDLYNTICAHVAALARAGKEIIIAAYSEGSKDRLKRILDEHGLDGTARFRVLGLEHGFETEKLAVLTEQDLLGDRLSRTSKKKRKNDAFVFELSQMQENDYVVHREHGVGQFLCLETVVVDGVPHDCLKLAYAGGDKLFVPVENLDVLSRYGPSETGATLDKLGGTAWQTRRARVKRDLLALADALLKTAAQRILRHAAAIHAQDGTYERFCAGFPYPETEDQQKSIDDVLADLAGGQAMDRLVCGDVGFGKTEVALRAAAAAALSGFQVALIAPTTLLARQHAQTFEKRFRGFPVRIGLLSRFVTAREADKTRAGLASGDVNIVIGTHALLGEKIKFGNLGLLIVDEEQKFGVKQKERLKEMREDVHVLTLTATPIPRTLQMALSGVRELSIIATPPVDRLAVRTFVLPHDPVVLRDALMREHYRGGQSFYVCPRIADIADLEKNLRDLVPELKLVVAHGKMTAEEMEDRMTAFYEGAYDILLSTNIVESGLDIPNANTMVIHRADMFGLAQLYQLRGRIGRGKQRAYAYLTHETRKPLTKQAAQRLQAIERLDTLGAGFQLASHDLDIRGAGNLLGEEQSGHIREIGVELYQEMLEEAVAAARAGVTDMQAAETHWSPVINMGMPVLIPENYIPDLTLRLSIYRRIAGLGDRQEIESFAAELTDRFGAPPQDVENLLDLVEIKQLCRRAGVDRLDAGPKGAVLSFRPAVAPDPIKLVKYISQQVGTVKMRPEDQKLVFIRSWDQLPQRMKGAHRILQDLAQLA